MKNVSIAMAVYNGGKFLQKQIDSIIPQLGEDDELIISYDKSTDNTWDIIKEYEEKYVQIKVFENNNPGVFGNFNNALSHCSGEYIFISDQDDLWADNKIETVLKVFTEKKVDMVIHNLQNINENDEVISEDYFSLYKIEPGIVRNFLKPRYSGCCTAFKKKLLKIILPMPQKVTAYDHWIGMIGECLGKVEFIKDVLINHRIHTNNVTPEKSRGLSVIFSARANLFFELKKRLKGIDYNEL